MAEIVGCIIQESKSRYFGCCNHLCLVAVILLLLTFNLGETKIGLMTWATILVQNIILVNKCCHYLYWCVFAWQCNAAVPYHSDETRENRMSHQQSF